MIAVMKRIRVRHCERSEAIQPPRRRRGLLRRFAPRNDGFLADRRGAVAFETLIVYVFLVTSLLLPLADVAAAGFQFISGWAALRSFGQYIQYNQPTDPTNATSWVSSLTTTTVSGYTMSNIKIICGDTTAPCSNATLTPKSYSYTTTVTLAPILLTAVLCPTSCTYTLNYSERFQ
jgi:hypothetical protein